jgi:hypothetical protein
VRVLLKDEKFLLETREGKDKGRPVTGHEGQGITLLFL